MKKTSILFIVSGMLVSFIVGFLIGRSHNEEQESPINYYCHISRQGLSRTIWVDPDYRHFPEQYAAEKYNELYQYYPQSEEVECRVWGNEGS